jgi:hypothetical protein
MKLPAIILLILTAFLASCYGAQQTINIGTTPSDGTGDTLRTAFGKVNTNFTELYSLTSAINASNITTGTLPIARIADGSLTNAKLLNSSVTINGTAVSLGGSISIASAANLTGLTDVTITSAATNDFLVKSAGDWVNLTPGNARTALGLGTLATQSATITDFALLSNPTFNSRINIAGGGVTSGLLHIFDADSSHSVRLIAGSSLAENYTLTLPSHTGTLMSSSTGAGGVLSGTYPNPSFATDMAEQSELTSGLATKEDVQTAASQAEAEAGTESAIRKFSPQRISQAITALAPKGTTLNVKNYGAKGDSRKVTDAVLSNNSTTVTSATANFTAADVGKTIWGVETASKVLRLSVRTIASVTNSTTIVVSGSGTGIGAYTGIHLVFGTNDTTAILAAVTAAKAMQPRALVEVPSGGYIFDKLLFDFTESASTQKAAGIIGHGTANTIFFPSPNHDLAATAMLAKTNGNCFDTRIEGFSVEGCYYQWSASGKHVIEMAGFINEALRDVRIEYLYGTTSGVSLTGYFQKVERVYIESLGFNGISLSSGASAWISESIMANCGQFSISIDGLTGNLNNKSFAVLENCWFDESLNGCVDVNNSTDVVITNCRASAAVGFAGLIVRGNSNVRVQGSQLLPWGTTGNRPGVDVASGSTLWLTNCRVDSAGTSHGITNAGTLHLAMSRVMASGSGTGLVNTGSVVDGGGNLVVSTSGAGTTRMLPMDRVGLVANASAPQLIAAGTTTGLRVYDDGTSARRLDAYLNGTYIWVATATGFTLNNVPISGIGRTNTPAGTTGARTINTQCGSVNFAAGATSLTVTNSQVTANSIVLVTMATNDSTAANIRAVPAAGSFTIHLLTAPSAEMKVNFLIFN